MLGSKDRWIIVQRGLERSLVASSYIMTQSMVEAVLWICYLRRVFSAPKTEGKSQWPDNGLDARCNCHDCLAAF